VESHGYDDFGHYLEVSGSETFTSLIVKGAGPGFLNPTQPGDTILVLSTAPHRLPGTRAYVLAKLYEEYKPMHVQLRYVPTISATQDGNLIYVPFEDPADDWVKTSERAAIIKATGYENNIMANVYQPVTIPLPSVGHDEDPLFTQSGSDARLEEEGFFAIIAGSTYSSVTEDVTLGWIKIDYSYRFYQPKHADITDDYTSVESLTNEPWNNVFSQLAVNPDDPLCGLENHWLLPGTEGGYYSLRLLSDFDYNGSPISVRTDNRSPFLLLQGTYLFLRRDTDKTSDCMNFFTNIEDMYSQNNPLRLTFTADPFLNVNVRYIQTFVQTDNDF
jgi:hypothetical protein